MTVKNRFFKLGCKNDYDKYKDLLGEVVQGHAPLEMCRLSALWENLARMQQCCSFYLSMHYIENMMWVAGKVACMLFLPWPIKSNPRKGEGFPLDLPLLLRINDT